MTITLRDKQTTYGSDTLPELVAELTVAVVSQGSELSRLGRRLGRLAHDTADHPFDNVAALAAHLIATVGIGEERQQRGGDLEASAAAYIGGTVARGNDVPEWARPYVKVKGKQDPDLYSTDLANTALTIKADVWSDGAVGIVGGAAKAKNEGKFKGICGQLRRICDDHGKQALVFAHHETPPNITRAAANAVGAGNVLIFGVDGQWTPLS
jgi:hypothetical protein